MKDYLLVFTENVDKYNMEKQLSFYSESDIYRYNLSENYDKIIECANEAKYLGYDSFHFISMNEDWAEMDFDLKRELKGFREVGVIKANFGVRRFKEADTQQKPIATVFPFPLLPVDSSGNIVKTYLVTLRQKLGSRQVAKTFYKKPSEKIKCSPEQYYSIAQKYFKDEPDFQKLFLPPKNDSLVQDYNEIEKLSNSFEILSPMPIGQIAGIAPAKSLVSKQGSDNYYKQVEQQINTLKKENLSGKLPGDLQQQIQSISASNPAAGVVINYIQNNVTNYLVYIENLTLNQININGNVDVAVDAAKKIVDWDGNKELNKGTPFALAQNLLGAGIKMATNYKGYNDEARKNAQDVTQGFASKTGLGKGAAEYFTKQNQSHLEKANTKKAELGADLAWKRDEKEFEIKKASLEKRLKQENDEETKKLIQSQLEELENTWEERKNNKDAIIDKYVNDNGGMDNNSKTKNVDDIIRNDKNNEKQVEKNMASETRRGNLIKKFIQNNDVLNSLSSNLQELNM